MGKKLSEWGRLNYSLLGYWLAWGGFLALGLKTAVSYPEYVQSRALGLNFWQVFIVVLVVTSGWAWWRRLKINGWWLVAEAGVSVVLTVVTVFLGVMDQPQELNYVLLKYGVHFQVVRDLALAGVYLGMWLLLSDLGQVGRRRWWFLAWWVIPLLTLYYWWGGEFLERIASEDKVIEWLSALVCGVGLVGAVGTLNWLGRRRRKDWLAILVMLAWAGGFGLLLAEELSWGQRVFGWEPGGVFVENRQQETNWHNLEGVADLMAVGYLILGVWGSSGWWSKTAANQRRLRSFPKLKRVLALTAPDFVYSSWFVAAWLYGLRLIFFGPLEYKVWEEVMELMLWTGMGLWVWRVREMVRET